MMDRTDTPSAAPFPAVAADMAARPARLWAEGWAACRAEMARLDPLTPMPMQSPDVFARAPNGFHLVRVG